MRRIFVLAVAACAFAVPLAAHAIGNPATGPRIALLAPPITFQAGAPFHVTQGFTCEDGKTACLSGLTQFDLFVDGGPQASVTDLTFDGGGALLSKFDLTNFPDGLTAGEHVLTGDWYWLGVLVETESVTIDFE